MQQRIVGIVVAEGRPLCHWFGDDLCGPLASGQLLTVREAHLSGAGLTTGGEERGRKGEKKQPLPWRCQVMDSGLAV